MFINLFLHQTTTCRPHGNSTHELFINLFLHQTTTSISETALPPKLFINLFLHQTTTSTSSWRRYTRCLSIFSYIKPQPTAQTVYSRGVVYQSFPTSNHNRWHPVCLRRHVVYQSFPTSNHNSPHRPTSVPRVVYQSFPTSNHNRQPNNKFAVELFINLFLHQTTTRNCGEV